MATIKTYQMPNSAILRLNSEKEAINTRPEYQRQGGIWTLEKRQLLIDSILNDYDIPKLYFHLLSSLQKKESQAEFDYAIIDGRQRIETIWEFLDGVFSLSNDFEYFADSQVLAAGLTYSELASKYPKLRVRFDSYILPVILVETEDSDLIEDMFSRLNEAAPLKAAEKRNAFGGPMAKIIRLLSGHEFFIRKVKFSNKRYQYLEVAARLLFLEYALESQDKIIDTKKEYLDRMVMEYKEDPSLDVSILDIKTKEILACMKNIFIDSDPLLRSQASVTIYYLLVRDANYQDKLNLIKREGFINFFQKLEDNRIEAEKNITGAIFEYLEFDRLSQQGTNDASSIRERTKIMSNFFGFESSYK